MYPLYCNLLGKCLAEQVINPYRLVSSPAFILLRLFTAAGNHGFKDGTVLLIPR